MREAAADSLSVSREILVACRLRRSVPLQLMKVFYISVSILTGLLSMCVELSLSVLLAIRVLKCFVTPTLTYTAQIDVSVLHICFESH